jgi:hypothetical protein
VKTVLNLPQFLTNDASGCSDYQAIETVSSMFKSQLWLTDQFSASLGMGAILSSSSQQGPSTLRRRLIWDQPQLMVQVLTTTVTSVS